MNEQEQMKLTLDIALAISPVLDGKSVRDGVTVIALILARLVKSNTQTKEDLMQVYLFLESLIKQHLFEEEE